MKRPRKPQDIPPLAQQMMHALNVQAEKDGYVFPPNEGNTLELGNLLRVDGQRILGYQTLTLKRFVVTENTTSFRPCITESHIGMGEWVDGEKPKYFAYIIGRAMHMQEHGVENGAEIISVNPDIIHPSTQAHPGGWRFSLDQFCAETVRTPAKPDELLHMTAIRKSEAGGTAIIITEVNDRAPVRHLGAASQLRNFKL